MAVNSVVSTTQLNLSLVRTDGGTQPRTEINYDVVREYAQDMMLGVSFPPIIIFFDGTDYWLADGFHRYYGAKQICREAIDADVREGTRRDAILYSVGTNAAHGLSTTVVTMVRLSSELKKFSERNYNCSTRHEAKFLSSLLPRFVNHPWRGLKSTITARLGRSHAAYCYTLAQSSMYVRAKLHRHASVDQQAGEQTGTRQLSRQQVCSSRLVWDRRPILKAHVRGYRPDHQHLYRDWARGW